MSTSAASVHGRLLWCHPCALQLCYSCPFVACLMGRKLASRCSPSGCAFQRCYSPRTTHLSCMPKIYRALTVNTYAGRPRPHQSGLLCGQRRRRLLRRVGCARCRATAPERPWSTSAPSNPPPTPASACASSLSATSLPDCFITR